jgi:hypothetical protein
MEWLTHNFIAPLSVFLIVMYGTASLVHTFSRRTPASTDQQDRPPLSEAAVKPVPALVVDPERPARLVIDRTAADAGELAPGQTARFKFILKNDGMGPLQVRAKAGCGCTLVKHDEIIQPGGAGTLEAELRTSGMRNSISKSIELQTNDPDHAKVQFSLTAKIVPAVRLAVESSPPIRLAMHSVTSHDVGLRSRESDGVRVLEARCLEPYAAAELVVSDTETPRIQLTIGSEAPLGQSDLHVVMKTTAKDEQEVTIPLRCEKGIVVSPRNVQLVLPRSGAAGKRIVVLSKSQGTFHVVGVQADHPGIETTIEPVRDGSSYRLILSCGSLPAGVDSTIIVVETDDADQPTVAIPVRILPAKAPPSAH